MATSAAPCSPTRRRASPQEIDADGPSLGISPTSSRSARSPPSEIPRTYSGLYGAGAPPMPDICIERDDDGDGGDDGADGGYAVPSLPISGAEGGPASSPSRHHHLGPESNLLPFELSRNPNTEWLAASGPALLATYVFGIGVFVLTLLAYVPEPKAAWTVANAVHALTSLVYLHWIKGNPADFADGSQGEMNAMTTWEQIVCKPGGHLPAPRPSPPRSRGGGGSSGGPGSSDGGGGFRESAADAVKKLRSRDVLAVVPTCLALASCYVAEFQLGYAAANVGIWACLMVPKMPAMNGVRILGINRTAGIDDGEADEDSSREEESSDDGGAVADRETDEPKKDR